MFFRTKVKRGDYVAFDACFGGANVGEVIAADRLSLLVKFDGEEKAQIVSRERCMRITEEERRHFHQMITDGDKLIQEWIEFKANKEKEHENQGREDA